MCPRPSQPARPCRWGASAVELALVLPLIGLLLLITIDFARLYYHYSIVCNCARNGALYGSDPIAARESPYRTVSEAALADATPDLTPTPTVNWTQPPYPVDSAGDPYIEVTVSYPFSTISSYPGLSNPINLTRTVRMRVAPSTPN